MSETVNIIVQEEGDNIEIYVQSDRTTDASDLITGELDIDRIADGSIPESKLSQDVLDLISDGGIDGKSAYEVAVENGFIGTESEWLESLVGADGEQGIQGEQGEQGEQGIQGLQGVAGADGQDAASSAENVSTSGTPINFINSTNDVQGAIDGIDTALSIDSINDNIAFSKSSTTDIFVSNTGNDSTGDGTYINPYLTLEEAFSNASSGNTVYMLNDYERSEKLSITSAQNGVKLKSYNVDKPAVFGLSVTVPFTSAVTPSTSITDRIDSDIRSNILEIDLTALGISADDLAPSLNLFAKPNNPLPPGGIYIDGEMLEYSRYPQKDSEGYNQYLQISSLASGGSANNGENGAVFGYTDTEIETWSTENDIHLFGFIGVPYAFARIDVESIDTANDQITLSEGSWYAATNDDDYYLYNIVEEIKNPGDKVVDRVNNKVYIYPPEGFNSSSVIKIIVNDQNLIEANGVDNFVLEDIVFEGTRATMVDIKTSNNIEINGFNVIGTEGIAFEIGEAGAKSNIVYNGTMNNIGLAPYRIFGGDLFTQEKSYSGIANVKIDNFGFNGSGRNFMDGVGLFSINTEHIETFADAVIFKGNHILFAYDKFIRTNTEGEDSGAVYTGRDPSSTFTRITKSIFANIGSLLNGTGTQGIYYDDKSGDGIIDNNLFYNVGSGVHASALKVNRGKRVDFTDNVVINGTGTFIQVTDPTLTTWNDFYVEQIDKLNAVDYDNPNSNWYLRNTAAYEATLDTVQPSTDLNTVTNNLFINSIDVSGIVANQYADPKPLKQFNTKIGYDPGFNDTLNLDFNISKDIFKSIAPNTSWLDATKIGYQDRKMSKEEILYIFESEGFEENSLKRLAYKNLVDSNDFTGTLNQDKITDLERNNELLKQALAKNINIEEIIYLDVFSDDFTGTEINSNLYSVSDNETVLTTQNDQLIITNDGSGSGSVATIKTIQKFGSNVIGSFYMNYTGNNLPNHTAGFRNVNNGNYFGIARSTTSNAIKFKVRDEVNGSTLLDAGTAGITFPNFNYFIITKEGNDLEWFYSTDGVTYTSYTTYTFDVGDELEFFIDLGNSNPGQQKTLFIDDLYIQEGFSLSSITDTDISNVTPLFETVSDTLTINATTVKDANGNILGSSSKGVGTTAERPASPSIGDDYYDTDLEYNITWNGTVWKDALGQTVN